MAPAIEALLGGASALPTGVLVGAIALVVVLSVLVGRLLQNALRGKKPPIWEGAPFVGGLLKFLKGPMWLMGEGYKAYGEVFTVPVAHKRITFLIGPSVSPHYFKATDEELSQEEVYNYSVPTFGKGVVFDCSQKVRTEQFRFFTEALKKERMRKYVDLFAMEAEQFFSKWGETGVIDFAKEFGKLVTLTAARTLLGREIREQMFEKVTDLLHDLDEGMQPISVMFPYLPTSYHARRDRARKELSAIFAKVIRQRRASGTREEDVLQQFIDAKYQNVHGGRHLLEEEITGLLIAVLFAGQHTSSITSAWSALYMAANKGAWNKAVDEQRAFVAARGTDISFDMLNELDVLHRNITEALRMQPPLVMLLRYVRQPFTVTTSDGKEYFIPKGDIVAASPNFSHTLPHIFKDPLRYDPERFAAPREEQKQHNGLAFIGFGAGRHACIGSNFAYLQIKTILTVLLRNFEVELLDPFPLPDYHSMVIGPLPCRVRYTRKKVL